MAYAIRGHLSISNKVLEGVLKNVVIGREHWQSAGSDRGGKCSSTIYTLIESAKHYGVNPYEYLRDVLTRLPAARHSEVPQLLPDTWLRAQADAQAQFRPALP